MRKKSAWISARTASVPSPERERGKRSGRLQMTKKIEAIIREEKLDAVKEALHEIGIVGMNISEVQGHGRQGRHRADRAGRHLPRRHAPRTQLNIVLSDHNVEKTIKTICEVCRTGNPGDGVIFIYPVEEVINVRTGERGWKALRYEGDIDTMPSIRAYTYGPDKES